MLVKRSYGINTQNRSMYPCTLERSQTVAVCHQVAVITFGLKYKQSEKSQKPYSRDIAQCLSANCHDASVIMCSGKRFEEK